MDATHKNMSKNRHWYPKHKRENDNTTNNVLIKKLSYTCRSHDNHMIVT